MTATSDNLIYELMRVKKQNILHNIFARYMFNCKCLKHSIVDLLPVKKAVCFALIVLFIVVSLEKVVVVVVVVHSCILLMFVLPDHKNSFNSYSL